MESHVITSAFSYGEIDPKLYAQVTFAAYQRGVRTALNVLSIPQGGFTRRFGTYTVATITTLDHREREIQAFVYDDSAIYCCIFRGLELSLFLENTLQTIPPIVTPYPAAIVQKLSFTQIENRLIILHENYPPMQLVRSSDAPNVITGVSVGTGTIILTTALPTGTIYPILFDVLPGNTLPVTAPQILTNTLYYARVTVTPNRIRIYSTPEDAAADINFYEIITVGTGISNVLVQNTWTLSIIPFSIRPHFDFGLFPTYSAPGFTFTASLLTGTITTPVVITASAAIFTDAMEENGGGLFIGNGGVMRILTRISPTQINGYTYENFINTDPFPGAESYLSEPAWSDARGYPRCGTFFQQRFFMGGSRSIPNGLWGSTLFQAYDFDDSQALADNAISFYTSAGQSNYIKALISSKSLLVHTTTGNYSTPLTTDLPLTPANFSLTEQNKDGIANVIPVFIDNQIVYVDRSNNNVKSMFWDIVQSSYVNTNISLPSAHLIDAPIDMAVFSEPAFTDGYFILAVNSNGQLAVFNSLAEQEVKGWTKAATNQNTTPGFFRRVTAALNRAWVIIERTINGNKSLTFEELRFDFPVDSGNKYHFVVPTTVLTGLGYLEGENVQVIGDGVLLNNQTVVGGQITTEVPVLDAKVGLAFDAILEPLPINVNLQTGPNLYNKQHIRVLYVHYHQTQGASVQTYNTADPTQITAPIPLNPLAIPTNGVLAYTSMEGWDAFEYTIRIKQSLPLPMTIIGLGYDMEV